MTRVLFLGKVREGYWGGSGSDLSSGLKNSVSFVVEMLNKNGIEAKFMQLTDNNKIDAAVTEYEPTHVILEAYWVVPSKMDVLLPLHPTVKWSVRNHSEMAFLANEGIAMEWTEGYLSRGMEIQSNSPRTVQDMATLARAWGHDPLLSTYAPNWYPLQPFDSSKQRDWLEEGIARIALFGAIRPLKNHLAQAVAAIQFAETLGRRLELHINATRIEAYGNPILKNMRSLFSNTANADLIEHPWFEHDEFLDVLSGMDYSMQVSFSETFNIVSADSVNVGVPVVASLQIPWMPDWTTADPNDATDIYNTLMEAESYRYYNTWRWQQHCELQVYADVSEANWLARYQ